MIDILTKSGQAILSVLAVGLVLGAGLPALFAAGMKALTLGRTVSADGATLEGKATPTGLALAGLCFALVVAAIVFGIVVIIFGNQIFTGH